jgi:hypothetical protein
VVRSSNRNSRPTTPVDSRKPAQQAHPTADADADEAFQEWDDLAEGTPSRDMTPVMSRTSTRQDPLTTGVLAEVTRRPEDTDPKPAVEPSARPTRKISAISRNLIRKPR